MNPIEAIGDVFGGGKNSVNDWTYETMKDAYFWTDEMPKKNKVDDDLAPNEYFEKLVYQPEQTDRFSMFSDDIDALEGQFNGVVKALGINFIPATVTDGQDEVMLLVSHTIPGSPADKAGVKRGDIISKINGQSLTKRNYPALMSQSETVNVTLANFQDNKLVADKDVKMSKVLLEANPVAYSKVLDLGGKKIGYLVYTQFVSGPGADKHGYDNQLREVFGQFKTAGVNELVLDLRLNPGGAMTSAVVLGSLIVPGNTGKRLYYTEQWNVKYTEHWKNQPGVDALNSYFKQEANNIGDRLSRVFVLTSNATASASELVIKGLEPYVQVITIGEHTAGKNLFGSLFRDSKKRWNYGMYLMLGKIANAEGKSDYGTVNGITPTRQVPDNKFPFLPFGDENETLLNAALQHMGVATGVNTRQAALREMTGVTAAPVKDTPNALDGRMLREMPK